MRPALPRSQDRHRQGRPVHARIRCDQPEQQDPVDRRSRGPRRRAARAHGIGRDPRLPRRQDRQIPAAQLAREVRCAAVADVPDGRRRAELRPGASFHAGEEGRDPLRQRALRQGGEAPVRGHGSPLGEKRAFLSGVLHRGHRDLSLGRAPRVAPGRFIRLSERQALVRRHRRAAGRGPRHGGARIELALRFAAAMLADLKKIPLFEGLPDEDLLMIAQRVAIRNVPGSEVIVREGDRTDALYVILSGKVKVYLGEQGGKELLLDVKGPGQYFGEMTLDDKARSASVMSLQPSRFAEISGADFKAVLLKHPETALHLIRNLIRVTRGLNEMARESGRKREKLRGYIDELGTKNGADSPGVKRWAKAKHWILAILLACAVLQYYFFDVFTQMMSLGGVNTFTGN